MITARLIKSKMGTIFAICDAGLLGNVYKEGKVVLDLNKYRNFFEGEKMDEDDERLNDMISEANSINAVGENSIQILAEIGYDSSSARRVQGVPYLQVYKIEPKKKRSPST